MRTAYTLAPRSLVRQDNAAVNCPAASVNYSDNMPWVEITKRTQQVLILQRNYHLNAPSRTVLPVAADCRAASRISVTITLVSSEVMPSGLALSKMTARSSEIGSS